PSRDFELLAAALHERDPGVEIVMRCRMVGPSPADRVVAVFSMLGQMYHLASAGACVVDGYVIPVSLLDHRPGMYVVQLWHAIGAIKKFGYQTVGRPGGHSPRVASSMRMHRNYDLVPCGGAGTVPLFAEAFGVDRRIVEPIGMPRMDLLRAAAEARDAGIDTASVAALRSAFPRLAEPGRTVVLYAPTFRKLGGDRYRDVAARFSGQRYTLIVKPHPLENASVEGANVINAGAFDILDVLPVCDAVITDYSAVAFEAAVMGVPVGFFVYDIDRYADDCGLNIDPLVEMASVASREIGPLADGIDAGDAHPEVTEMLRARYASAPAGCADRIAERILARMRTA
ncbi:MAG TPA: CDP-glycerol glycerophosphotransferase family protein, partial [Coriobacteriia bacterium]